MNESQVLKLLKELNQDHIVEKYCYSSKKEQKDFIIQFNKLDKICRGGLKNYINTLKISILYPIDQKYRSIIIMDFWK